MPAGPLRTGGEGWPGIGPLRSQPDWPAWPDQLLPERSPLRTVTRADQDSAWAAMVARL